MAKAVPGHAFINPGESGFRRALPWVLFVTFLFLLNYSARCALSPLLVSIEEDLGIGHAQATSLLLMQGIGMSVSLGLGGFVLGVVRPRHMVAFSLFACGVCFLLIPFCTTLAQARIAFLAFGLVAGLYFAPGMTTLGSLVLYKDWGKVVGIHELAPNLSFILFPLIAQFLLVMMPWRGVFTVWGAIMCVASLLFLRFGRGGYAYAEAPSWRGSVRLLRQPTLWGIMYLLVIALIGEYAIFSVLQLYLVSSLDLDAESANYLMSVSRLAAPVMVIIGGLAADRLPVRRYLCVMFFLHAAGVTAMALSDSSAAYVGIFVQALSIALSYPALFKLIAECYPSSMQPMVLSLTLPASGLFATGLAPSMLGLAGETVGFSWGLGVVVILSLLCIPAILFLRRWSETETAHGINGEGEQASQG